MLSAKSIEHPGVISEVSDTMVRVSFTAYSACSACHAKGICSAAEMQDKSVEIPRHEHFDVDEKVKIILKQSLGYRALFLSYVLPFLIVLLTLVLFSVISDNELITGMISLTILFPYYLMIYLFRGQIKRDFSFFLKKLD